MKVSCPTNGSVMILKPSAANGASSFAGRSSIASGPLFGIEPVDRRHVDRRRQVIDDRVEQRLHALVLERRAADHRHERRLRLLPSVCTDVFTRLRSAALISSSRDLFAVEVLLEELVVRLADLLDQLLAEVLRLLEHVGGNLADDVVGAHRLVLVGDRLHLDEVDHADELVLGADGQLDRDGIATELR